jgi:hypothetical protein
MGQLGGVFGHGLLRLGHPVLPILRGDSISQIESHDPELVLVAVAENDLDDVLRALPASMRARVALLQNELLPPDWERHGIIDPTVAVVWFEKKRGRAAHVIDATPVGGPHAGLLVRALEAVDLPAKTIDVGALPLELVRKNLYILGANLAGLAVSGTTGELGREHREWTTSILEDVISIEEARLHVSLPREALIEAVFVDFERDPNHATKGRSAPERLTRAIARADEKGLAIAAIRSLIGASARVASDV